MKIAMVDHPERSHVSFSKGGSVEIWIHEVARRLAQSCEVVTYSTRGSLPEEEWCDGVRYRRIFDWTEELLRRFGKMKGARHAARKLHDFHSGLYYIGYSLAVAKDLRSQGCDIIHIINLSQYAPIFRALNPRSKIVLHMHSQFLTSQPRTVVERRLKRVDQILACCNLLTTQIRSAFPDLAQSCTTLYNGVDVECFNPDGATATNRKDEQRIIFAGRISPEKGLHVLLEAFALVVKHCPLAKLEIAGPPEQMPLGVLPSICSTEEVSRLKPFYDGLPYNEHLKQQIDRLHLGGSVVFSGYFPHAELAQHYRHAQVCVLPSIGTELFSMTAIEAMCSGIPVVASRVGGIPEAVEDGRTGLLVAPNDPTVLAGAILRLLENESLRQSMGEAARRKAVALFSWEKVANDLLQIYAHPGSSAHVPTFRGIN